MEVEQLNKYTPILPPSNINYYDLSPYVNTAEVFQRNIVQLEIEIKRILIDTGIKEPLLESRSYKEIEILTGYNPRLFFVPTTSTDSVPRTDESKSSVKVQATTTEIQSTASAATTTLSPTPTNSAPTMTPSTTSTAL